ncbi:FISUMP domain-containing protein [uncultured Fibrobacter sp.]|uniref:FISUMP domain-containing protein n=1 Tax=uncultured Fibrobacter sp. TaxID=261512 RepID=UPI002634BA15|nr:FISUMP domain-containing protein [uncultured Fibrobacter sp.]
MNYLKRQMVCKMAVLFALTLAACSTDDGKPETVMGGSAEETGLTPVLADISVGGQTANLPSLVTPDGNEYDENTSIQLNVSLMKVFELDSLTLDTTGVVYEGAFINGSGKFEIDSVTFKSPYAQFEIHPNRNSDDWYDGIWYKDYVPYQAIVDLRETRNVNVNVMTYLEAYRLRYLVNSGKTFAEAKAQADREVLAAFGIEGVPFNFEKNEHAADSDVVEVLQFMNFYIGSLSKSSVESLAQKFGEDGTLDNIDEETKKLFTAWSFSKLNTIVKEDAQGVLKMSELSKEINTNFAILMQGLEECTAEKEGAVIENSGVLFNFVCTSKKWTTSVKLAPYVAGSMTDERDGKTYKTVTYTLENGTQTWFGENLMFNSPNGYYSLSEVLALDTSIVMVSLDECLAESEVPSLCDTLHAMGNNINYDRMMAAIDSVEKATGTYQGVCPDGWRLPNGNDWEKMFGFVKESLDLEVYTLADYLFAAGFGNVTSKDGGKEVWTYYAVKPDSAYSNPRASMIMFESYGKWLVQQRPLWSNQFIQLNVRCIKDE